MTSRDTYNTTVLNAGTTKTASLTNNQLVHQEAINAVGVNVGTNPQLGCSNSQIASIKAAAKAKIVADTLAEMTKQVTINVAKDTLRDSGDKAPA